MAIDSFQKRMSATNISCPWRGALVDATEAGFNVGNRAAAMYFYSGITPVAVTVIDEQKIIVGTGVDPILNLFNTNIGYF